MRIEANSRTREVNSRPAAGRAVGGAEFRLADAGSTTRAASPLMVSVPAGIDALLALQAVGNATEGRRRAVKRGRTLLDTLEVMRADLLSGRVDPAALDRLIGVLAEGREVASPQIDAVLDDIELRVRVELAKHGRYPAL